MMALGKEIELVDCNVSPISQIKLSGNQPGCTYCEIQLGCCINHCTNCTGTGRSFTAENYKLAATF